MKNFKVGYTCNMKSDYADSYVTIEAENRTMAMVKVIELYGISGEGIKILTAEEVLNETLAN